MRIPLNTPGGGVKPTKNHIPNLHRAANALAVTDGAVVVGFVVEHDGSHFSFDKDGILVGENADAAMTFPDWRAAVTCYQQDPKIRPVRNDGKSNRPLTAYTILID